MDMRTAITVALMSAGLMAGQALAADKPNTVPKDTCTAKAPPPAEMASWSAPDARAAATEEAGVASAALTPGKAVTARFAPVAEVHYRVPPEKADGPATFGGLYSLKIAETGTYRIASSAGPWMDVFADKTPVTSTAHGHGPECTGIGKMVDFPLQPGDYLVQFSESLKPTTEIMVVKLAK
jgi:hypothetical protein